MAVFSLKNVIIPEHPWFVAAMAYVGKFGIAGSFAVIYIFSGELYPTVVRAIGMELSSMVAGSGLILAPYLVRLVSFYTPKGLNSLFKRFLRI